MQGADQERGVRAGEVSEEPAFHLLAGEFGVAKALKFTFGAKRWRGTVRGASRTGPDRAQPPSITVWVIARRSRTASPGSPCAAGRSTATGWETTGGKWGMTPGHMASSAWAAGAKTGPTQARACRSKNSQRSNSFGSRLVRGE
ncbi:hypothetical protein GCM10010300_75730 [Streptomyces olivaceoviridis]|nr:hypothetical protein GCM10010300_75730 [Streptomyces olivaceoviridis]